MLYELFALFLFKHMTSMRTDFEGTCSVHHYIMAFGNLIEMCTPCYTTSAEFTEQIQFELDICVQDHPCQATLTDLNNGMH